MPPREDFSRDVASRPSQTFRGQENNATVARQRGGRVVAVPTCDLDLCAIVLALRARWSRCVARLGCIVCVVAASTLLHSPRAIAQAPQRTLVNAATVTLTNFLADPNMTWLKDNLASAKAVIIAPEIARAGFIVGGSGGRAVALARDPATGRWAGPAFYTLATASVGLQVGISVSEVVELVMTDAGMRHLVADSFQMSGDVAIAAGPVGHGARADLASDFVSFSRSQGAYVGADLTGTVVATSNDWNHLYYGREVDTSEILLRRTAHNRQANELLHLLALASKH